MTDFYPDIPVDDLIARGLYDPDAPDAGHRLLVIGRVLDRGGTLDDIADHGRDLESLELLATRIQLRAASARYTFDEIAERAGLDVEDARRINRAAGFPDPDPAARIFDDDDAELLIGFNVAASFFGTELMLQLARVMGSAMARVADAMISTFASYAGEQSRVRELDERDFASANTSAIAMLPNAVRGMEILLRRHMEALSRSDAEFALGDEWQGLDTLERGVGFCDLVGYTELSEQLTAGALADVLERFEGRAADIIVGRGGSVVKLIGDEVMFVAPDAGTAPSIALDLVASFGSDGLPPVRVGVAAGRVILREADYYGTVVNLAARIVKLATPGGVLAPASMCPDMPEDIRSEDAGSHLLKGFDEAVALVELRRR